MQNYVKGWGAATVVSYGAAMALFLVSIAQFHRPGTGFTFLINFGDQFGSQRLPAVSDAEPYIHANSPGYDGQFYAQMAVDPLLRDRRIDQALDWPPYRARRILFSWTAYLLGLGRPVWILKAYALQNIVAWVLLALLLLRWFPPTSARHFAAWFGCLFGSGLLGSVRFGLLECPSMLLLALAIAAVERGRPWIAAGVVAAAGLGRETNLLSAGMLANSPRWTKAAALAAAGQMLLVVLPLTLWIGYLGLLYPSAAPIGASNLSLPLVDYVAKWQTTLNDLRVDGLQSFARFSLWAIVALTVQAAFLLAHRDWTSPWWRAGIGYVAILACLGPAVWEGVPGAAIRVLVPLSFAFNVLVTSSRWFWPLVVAGNLSALHGLQMIQVPWLWRLL